MKDFSLMIEFPANCAKLLMEGKAQVGLVPVGGLSELSGFNIISDYCIGAIGKVNSVSLYSKVPLEEIHQIHLDNESLTSVKLVKVLANQYWKIHPKWISIHSTTGMHSFDYESVVLIGDKTFGQEKKFTYVYDLAEQWMSYTHLPFVFAAWVAQEGVSKTQIEELNNALKWGVERIEEAVEYYPIKVEKAFAIEYLKKYINYPLDDLKKDGLKLFIEKLSSI